MMAQHEKIIQQFCSLTFSNVQQNETMNFDQIYKFFVKEVSSNKNSKLSEEKNILKLAFNAQFIYLLHPHMHQPIKKLALNYFIHWQLNEYKEMAKKQADQSISCKDFTLYFLTNDKMPTVPPTGNLQKDYHWLCLLGYEAAELQKFKQKLMSLPNVRVVKNILDVVEGNKIVAKSNKSAFYLVKPKNSKQAYLMMQGISVITKNGTKNYRSIIESIQKWSNISHPSISSVVAIYRSKNTLYVLSQPMKTNLKEFYRKYGPNPEITKNILSQMLQIMTLFHSKDLFHADISIHTVFVEKQKEQIRAVIKGIGKEYETVKNNMNDEYMVSEDEQKNYWSQTEKKSSDIEALGKVFYFMLTLNTQIQCEISNLEEDIIYSVSGLAHSMDSSIDYPEDQAIQLLMRMLDPSPQTRISSAEALNHSYFNKN